MYNTAFCFMRTLQVEVTTELIAFRNAFAVAAEDHGHQIPVVHEVAQTYASHFVLFRRFIFYYAFVGALRSSVFQFFYR